ncbi:hypothetical protein [Silvimonas iriomotensis]|uniref:Lipoprotein n=1 Tax=Silvimonas iriomotensis TaxID=449662 RepID=A0ABQ2P8G4_9NEIS|nr:hypothetical protein [Silvimonas iriomotensis]GGP20783.1 hypothetical protein GCM10010970_16930 [Silvimonas iriomotensis]
MERVNGKRLVASVVALAAVFALAACGKSSEGPKVALDDKDLINTLNNFIQADQQNCVSMPIAFNTPVAKDYAKLTDPNGAQLAALVKVGLIAESAADGGQVQFTATDKGKDAYDGNTPPGFCSGTPEVDKVVSNTVEETADNYSRDKVVFTTKLDGVADWAKDDAIRQQYPKFATLLDNQGKEQHSLEIESRGQGWRVLEPSPVAN